MFKNVQVFNDLGARVLAPDAGHSTWVAPEEGCEFCHNPKKLESDEKYTKVVARRMIQMTRRSTPKWKTHVGETGVTCWTCHRGQAVPSGDWFNGKGPMETVASSATGRPERAGAERRRLVAARRSAGAVPDHRRQRDPRPVDHGAADARAAAGVKSAEWTYSLMLYMSGSLGVNCTYCHNTRALARWEESTPQRVTAWYGIRMVRELNTDFLMPLDADLSGQPPRAAR